MFVDGIAMVEIAKHEQVDGLELRDSACQQIQRMHGAQGVCGVWLRQDLAQVLPQILILRHGLTQALMSIVDAPLGFGA